MQFYRTHDADDGRIRTGLPLSGCVRHDGPGWGTTGTMALSAVTTTGIYCHPGCSASPNPTNVVPYESAAAAEADGFRACLRCRPYRTHHADPWVQGPELVCRATRLIVDGALDFELEADLAKRLGVSARHLRRLFLEHVGATPDQVARSRRAHFARRLLDDSDLPISDIAFAAGFGSVRQMSRVMHDVFQASATELRAKRRQSDRLVADGGLDTRLTFRPPLAWDALLAFLAPRAIPGVESVANGTYRRTIEVDGLTGALEVWRDHDHLMARFHLPRWEGLIHHVARVRRLFDLDHDPNDVSAALRDDAALSPWPAGLRVPGCWDPFEAGVRAIVGQQVSVAGAATTMGKIVAAHGVAASGLDELGLGFRFPQPAALVDADLPIPRRRATAVRAFAEAVAERRLPLDASIPLDRFAEQVCTLPGVGPWTAQYLALRLGYADAFPASDLGVIKALGGASLTGTTERAEAWRPWRAYATFRLWSR
jgi:AraC family transcriptional regulator, regulatory protein of adaptative response / DNA-3-methyladenine glycosylase II